MKIVINAQHGGFGLSAQAYNLYSELVGKPIYLDERMFAGMPTAFWVPLQEDDGHYQHMVQLERTDPYLIEVVEKIGENANGACASLKIVEIPDDVQWDIHEYDGLEWIAELHRTWS